MCHDWPHLHVHNRSTRAASGIMVQKRQQWIVAAINLVKNAILCNDSERYDVRMRIERAKAQNHCSGRRFTNALHSHAKVRTSSETCCVVAQLAMHACATLGVASAQAGKCGLCISGRCSRVYRAVGAGSCRKGVSRLGSCTPTLSRLPWQFDRVRLSNDLQPTSQARAVC
jgi:hypothetical protein